MYYGSSTDGETTPSPYQTTPTVVTAAVDTTYQTTTTTTYETTPIVEATPTAATTATQSQATPTDFQATAAPTEYHCGGILTDDVGSFHSENWPNTYPVNVVCEWKITLPNPRLFLEILFDDNPFGLAAKMPKCRRDWVKVYSMDANLTVTSTWGPFCGFQTPPSISTKTSIAMIQFHSGSKHGRSRKGFRVRYQALEVCIPLPPPLKVEGMCATSHHCLTTFLGGLDDLCPLVHCI